MGCSSFEIEGLVTKSPENGNREHWAVRKKRISAERQVAYIKAVRALVQFKPFKEGERFRVTLTRMGTRKMDDDNAIGSLKHVRDGIADAIGIDDGDTRVEWAYRQVKAPAGVGAFIEWGMCE